MADEKKQKRNWRVMVPEQWMRRLDLPLSSLGHDFYMEIQGEENAVVFGCRAILAYGDDEILLRVRSGVVCIQGAALEIASLVRDCVTVLGKIRAVYLREELSC